MSSNQSSQDDLPISVVLVATESPTAVRRFLSAWDDQRTELIVAAPRDRVPPFPSDRIGKWVDADPGTSVPRLRRLGLDASHGGTIVFTEDNVVPGTGWPGELAASEIGTGPVQIGESSSSWDRAIHLFEYGCFAPGLTSTRLAGNNFALSRSVASELGDEIHENEIEGPFQTVQSARVVHVRAYGVREAIRDRFSLAFDYGARRWAGRPRLLGALLVPLIFGIQMRRMFKFGRFNVFGMSLLIMAWSLGEGLGLLCGKRSETSARSDEPASIPRIGCRVEQPAV